MPINELINDGLRSQFLINLNSYSLNGAASSLYHQRYFRGAVEQSISGMAHLVDSEKSLFGNI